MIVSVGTGRSGEDIANGLAFSINQTRFDELCLIGSSSSEKQTFPYLLEKITGLAEGCLHKKINDEVNDVEYIIDLYDKYFQEFINAGFRGENITVDYTSGTKSMSAALLFCAIRYEVRNISYVYGERNEGIVQTGTERRSILTPNLIFSQRTLDQVRQAFNKSQFHHALTILEGFNFHPRFKSQAIALSYLCRAYDAWDKFAFKIALESLKKISREDKMNTTWGSIVGRQLQLLERLANSAMSKEHVVDLFYNAERRAIEGKYDDAVARLYRLLEMIGQVEFFDVFGLENSGVHLDKMPPEVTPEDFPRAWSESSYQFNFGLFDTFRILNIVGNGLGSRFTEHTDDLLKLLSTRNKSILAHGLTPISSDVYKKMRDYTKLLIYDHTPFAFPMI